ncbi:hypothetical protein NNC19_08475 [Clostridium sp. SHJSY1]|uniref:hypothetical protein n=1 Tax=Clostridium sp. SHJSY1 TaxID=2942483 RepID=UPI002874389C|nr:hypothetical protein [Clostridium sp. SHJSY1]MDS0525711.1 hypothetical protein [Clostridium sp. SHJSY1]
MIALLKYNYKIYMKENKFIVPFLLYFLFHGIFYSTGTEKFVPGVIVCASVLFCLMTWMGFSYSELQDIRTEQIAFLKINNENIYWFSKILFMSSIGGVLSIFGVVFPIIRNLKSDDININNLLLGFFILIIASFMGILIGMIFQTRVVGNRDRALLFILFITLVAIIKIPIGKEYAFTKIITWIVPPINDITNSCIGIQGFSFNVLIFPMIWGIVYIFVEIYIYIKLMKKILF